MMVYRALTTQELRECAREGILVSCVAGGVIYTGHIVQVALSSLPGGDRFTFSGSVLGLKGSSIRREGHLGDFFMNDGYLGPVLSPVFSLL